MAVKPIRILYQAKNNTTGLTDVLAQVYLNGTGVAVAGSAVALTELDATNSPGLYELLLSSANLVTYGVVSTQRNTIEGYINSATQPARAPFREEVYVSTTDDLAATLGTPAGASVSADIASVKSDTSAIKVDLETGPNSLANIYAGIQAVQNNAGFAVPVPSQMVVPATGSTPYVIPIRIYNSSNMLIDPDSNSIVVTLVNQAGTDLSAYLTGASGGSAPAVRNSMGVYHINLAIPSTATIGDELIFGFAYSIATVATSRVAVSELVSTTITGVAQQSTLLALQTDVTNNVEGSGFSNSTDSLHQISLYLRANIFVGGRAV